MPDLLPVIIVALLIVLNGIFVAAEFAIVSVPRTAMDRLSVRGHRGARMVQRILRSLPRQDRVIATAQLGITLASLGLGMYGEHMLAVAIAERLESWGAARWVAAHTVASVLAITILTYLHIVVGEMVPKSLALQKAERTALWIVPVILFVQVVLYPFVFVLNGLSNGMLRLLGIHRQAGGSEQVRTAEDLAYVVRESQAGGLLRSGAAKIVQDLLDFGDLRAEEVMVPRVRVVGIELGAGLDEVRAALRTSPHTRYPVYDGTLDQIVGTFEVKELLRDIPPGSVVTREVLKPAPIVPTAMTMDRVLGTLRDTKSQMVVVLDEYGGTAGILTVEDLFEEVVGEFGEDANAPRSIYRDAGGRWHVAGTVRLDELGSELGRVLEHDEVDTVGGLVLTLLGRPAVAGDTVAYDGVRYEVVRVEGRAVSECVAVVIEESPLS
ncbi:MAG TPA: hemolysin family protein [Gemmatimonadaceae bacterium]|nr:hemolysin family protein [Gemmatimonadaceae bacterium]